jgi:3-deoxy-7-phosphoheptulonate synthase
MADHPIHTATDDIRIEEVRPLIAPAILIEDIPCTEDATELVARTRREIVDCLTGKDDRLVGIIGPCSIHDVDAALEYGRKLKELADQHRNDLLIVMRTYFEKPRTVGGWKGLMNDPMLDGSHQINKGLRMSRQLLADLAEIGMPVACEFLDNILPQFISDHVVWAAIGARTTESQIHRQFASGCSMPVGFKNSTTGSTQTAIDAIQSAAMSHWFSSVTKQGISAILKTSGNPNCHLILRGGSETGPNYGADAVSENASSLRNLGLQPRMMVDFSHGNSGKDHKKQRACTESVADQIRAGSDSVFGFMMESFLVEGSQAYAPKAELTYGQSITDACVDFSETAELVATLADSVRARRALA